MVGTSSQKSIRVKIEWECVRSVVEEAIRPSLISWLIDGPTLVTLPFSRANDLPSGIERGSAYRHGSCRLGDAQPDATAEELFFRPTLAPPFAALERPKRDFCSASTLDE